MLFGVFARTHRRHGRRRSPTPESAHHHLEFHPCPHPHHLLLFIVMTFPTNPLPLNPKNILKTLNPKPYNPLPLNPETFLFLLVILPAHSSPCSALSSSLFLSLFSCEASSSSASVWLSTSKSSLCGPHLPPADLPTSPPPHQYQSHLHQPHQHQDHYRHHGQCPVRSTS